MCDAITITAISVASAVASAAGGAVQAQQQAQAAKGQRFALARNENTTNRAIEADYYRQLQQTKDALDSKIAAQGAVLEDARKEMERSKGIIDVYSAEAGVAGNNPQVLKSQAEILLSAQQGIADTNAKLYAKETYETQAQLLAQAQNRSNQNVSPIIPNDYSSVVSGVTSAVGAVTQGVGGLVNAGRQDELAKKQGVLLDMQLARAKEFR